MSVQFRYRLLFSLFILSGFAGLIYESIWSHYLKLFLGHAAYSQTLVLIMFMGGMALGAWLATALLKGRHKLLLYYALAELLIGVLGLVFHGLFQGVMAFSFDTVIPMLESPLLVLCYKWLIGGLLILPQSILLGTTFPLMTNGLLRIRPDLPGRSVALLYFGNSIGAAAGVLVSGFYLIALVGIPGTIMAAAIINILIAIIVYGISKGTQAEEPASPSSILKRQDIPRLILCASFLTGTASFIYELSWVRMLSMVLGASTHAFELMLSAFITGLAFGGLWIRNRVDGFGALIKVGAMVQIAMGLLALSTLLIYDQTFDLMAMLIRALDTNEDGYLLFNMGSHFIALLVMLPATFLAGMTLPIFTLILLRDGYGEESVSHIYVTNMFGAIVGILFVTFIGMPLLGLKGSMLVGCAIDLVLGYVLLYHGGYMSKNMRLAGVSLLVFIVIGTFAELDPLRMSSSVFRMGQAVQGEDTSVIFHQDGKTSTVTVLRDSHDIQTIFTNGKPDASVDIAANRRITPIGDEITQVLLAALPLAIHPEAARVANIGIGSGMTSHTVLLSDAVEQLDTIEIEAEMVRGAETFRPHNDRVFSDPRSRIHLEDARSFLSLNPEKYDIIISEPSNPWVSGVSSLYTTEFYRHIRRSIAADGYLVQWLHLYEFNRTLFFSVLKSLSENFSDYHIYATNNFDILIVARVEGKVGPVQQGIFGNPESQSMLARVGMTSLQDFNARYLANKALLYPLIQGQAITANSDYFPVLDLYAPRARFMRNSVTLLLDLKMSPLPVARYLGLSRDFTRTDIGVFHEYIYSRRASRAQDYLRYMDGDTGPWDGLEAGNLATLEYLVMATRDCDDAVSDRVWIREFYSLLEATLPYLGSDEMDRILARLESSCMTRDGTQQQWLALARAIGDRDYSAITRLAGSLVGLLPETLSTEQRYLQGLRLLGLYMQSEDAAFQALFQEVMATGYRDRPPPFELELLYGQVLQRQ